MARPAARAAHQPGLGANQEDRQAQFLSVRTLARQANKVVADRSLRISGSRVHRLVRQFVREGRTDIDFRVWFLHYADPTGETAARRADRTRRDCG